MLIRIVVTLLCFSVLSSNALAQPQMCGPRAEVIKALKGSRFSEVVFATGKAGKDVIVEFFVNIQTGSFTVLATRVRSITDGKVAGNSCIIAGGVEFQMQEPQPQPEPTKHTMLKFFQLQ